MSMVIDVELIKVFKISFENVFDKIIEGIRHVRLRYECDKCIPQIYIVEHCVNNMLTYGCMNEEQTKIWNSLSYDEKLDLGKICMPCHYYE